MQWNLISSDVVAIETINLTERYANNRMECGIIWYLPVMKWPVLKDSKLLNEIEKFPNLTEVPKSFEFL